jgi:Tol biopolymer transport system component
MPAFGGSPTLLKPLESRSHELIAWSRAGKIYLELQRNVYALDVTSHELSQLTKFDPAKILDRSFSVSPDEHWIAYTDETDGQIDIFVMQTRGGPPVRVTNDKAEDSNLVWTPDSQRIIYSSNRKGIKQIFLAHADGRMPVQLTVNDSDSEVVDVSLDGAKILYTTAREDSDLWSVKLDQPRESQVTSDIGIELWPDVSPDGRTIAYQATHATTGAKLLNCLLLAKSLTSEAAPTQLAPDGYAPLSCVTSMARAISG